MPLPLPLIYEFLFPTLQVFDNLFVCLVFPNLIACLWVSVTLCCISLSRSGKIIALFKNLMFKEKIPEWTVGCSKFCWISKGAGWFSVLSCWGKPVQSSQRRHLRALLPGWQSAADSLSHEIKSWWFWPEVFLRRCLPHPSSHLPPLK